MKKNAYIIFSRVPVSGKTKTRLMPYLTGDECANIHKMFLLDLFLMSENLKENVDIFLSYSNDGNPSELLNLCPNFISSFPQEGQSLGEKMNNSINLLLSKGYEKVILTGSDIPNIDSTIILNGFKILNSNDIVLAPTLDGGYYLIGCSNPIDDVLTSPMKWGHDTVFENTMNTITFFNKTCGLTTELNDIDTIDDLIKFIKCDTNLGYTFKFAKSLNLEERIKHE